MKNRIIPIEVAEYCIREVVRQHDEAVYVQGMLSAWMYAWSIDPDAITEDNIFVLGALVKKREVTQRYRPDILTHGFTFQVIGAPPEELPRLMQQLIANQDCDTDVWIKEFLDIHPFPDGNGRVASLLRNIRKRISSIPKIFRSTSSPVTPEKQRGTFSSYGDCIE